MPSYLVTWEMDLEVNTPREAAEEALRLIKNTETWTHVFDVTDENGDKTMVDLDVPEDEPPRALGDGGEDGTGSRGGE